jgi:hypothetical protein
VKTRAWIRGLVAPRDRRTLRRVLDRARLLVEALEDRSVPSVIVAFSGGNLKITDPDTSHNTIEVDQTTTQGAFTVEVDGGSSMPFTGVKNIKANLGVASDTLTFENLSSATTNLSGNLSVTATAWG